MKKILSATLLVCVLGMSGCGGNKPETELAGIVQGTTYHIKLALKGKPFDLESIRKSIEDAFNDIDLKLSNYREDSEISRLNQQKTTQWLPVSHEIAELVAIAKYVHDRSEGCYDLTVKPIFDLWGFSRHQNRVPSREEIDQALTHVGMQRLEVDVPNSRIRKQDPQLQIDLSSIAQGYSVGVIANLLEARGIQDYLVEIGGEMKVKGRKGNGNPWRVAIEKPTPFTSEVQKILDIHEQQGTAIMTAGTYRNFFEEKGQTYSHIINPKTGSPVTHHLVSVTVLHDDPSWADAWDTALLCVGETAAAKIADEEHLKALLIFQQDQKLEEHMSQGFLERR